jgi:hypothetical protein
MPAIEGRLDLRLLPSATRLTALIDTGFDGDLAV